MPYENGENWLPVDPDKRGRHGTFAEALKAAVSGLAGERSDFFDSLADRWPSLFSDFAARPGRYDDGRLFLYVKSAPALFAMRPRLASIKRTLAALPGAPKKLDVCLEIHR